MPTEADAALARQAFFGTCITPCTFDEWLADIATALDSDQKGWLCGHHNLHSLYLLQRNDEIRRFYQRCNSCYIDGTPVRIILRGLEMGTTNAQRFSLMDHFLELLEHAQHHNWSVFYLGSQASVVDIGTTLIKERFPRLRIQLHHGYVTNHSDIVDTINEWQPDLLLVGMGMPMQERWIMEHIDSLDAGFVTQAGATLDYFAGAQAKPPVWLSRCGFAWLYRLAYNPSRLWRRYLIEPWALLYPTLRHWYRFSRIH